jgi:uncharacterized membrane protein YkvA (DUF1232 family)
MFERLESTAASLKRGIRFYRLVAGHGRTPRLAKWLLGLAVAYALLPFDIIPDFIPVLGHLDDLIVIPLLVVLAVRMVPEDVMRECREQSRGALGAETEPGS